MRPAGSPHFPEADRRMGKQPDPDSKGKGRPGRIYGRYRGNGKGACEILSFPFRREKRPVQAGTRRAWQMPPLRLPGL